MSVITVEVAGVDQTDFVYKASPPNWNDQLNSRGTGGVSFLVPYADLAAFRPADGQKVEVIEDGTVRFGGYLVEPQLTDLIDEEEVIFDCGMKDNNATADRRVITASYEDTLVEDIIADIVSNSRGDGLNGEGITTGGVVAGIQVSLDFPTIYVVDALNDLAIAAGGWWWNIGHDKDMDFAPRSTVAAPGDLTGANTLKKTPKLRPALDKYRNIEYVLAGNDDFQIVAGYFGSGEVQARSAIEGTTGRYEHIEERQDILDPVIAEDLAADLVNRFGAVTLYFECITRDPGYASGQEVDLTFPALLLSADTFLIDSVSAQVHYTSPDGTDIQEIWYGVTAITGDPFGGWMEHYRKRPGPTQTRKIVPAPGVQVECDPGVLVHAPPPGPYDWFQAATTAPTKFPSAFGVNHLGNLLVTQRFGGLANTDGCGGGEFPGFGGTPACFANRQMIAECYFIAEDNTISTVPDFGNSTDMLNVGANVKTQIPISPGGDFALFTHMKDAGVDSVVMVYDILTNQFRGSVISTMLENSNWSEPIWIGDVVYFVDGSGTTIFMYDISDPDFPTETTFASSVTGARNIVASPNGQVLYVLGTGTDLAALDISSPLAPVEDTVLTIVGGYGSMDVRPDGTALIMFRRASATVIRWTSITMTLNGTDIAFSSNDADVPGTISTNDMEGRGVIWPGGDTAICSASQPTFPANSFETYVFECSDIDVVTLVEIFSYNHGGNANSGPIRSLESAKFLMWFGGITQQITYAVQTFPECVEISTQWPLEADFGGTGHKLYAVGDILYANTTTSLVRLPIGDPTQILTVTAGVPTWEDAQAVPSGQDAAILLSCMPADVEFEATTLVDISALSQNVVSGETYYFRAELFFDIGPTDSHRYAIGGTCQGDIRYQVRALNDLTSAYSIVVSGQHAVLGGEAFIPSGLLTGYTEISGCINVTGDGTLVPQIALNDPIPGPASLFTEPRGYIDGMETSNAADAEHDITFQPGVCRSRDDSATIVNGAEITKRIDAGFSEGDGGGGLDTGSVAADTEYNMWAIAKDDATVDFLFSLSATAPTMPFGFTRKRRIGSVFTEGSANIRNHHQTGDWFFYVDQVRDVNDTTGAAGTFEIGTMSVPPNSVITMHALVRLDPGKRANLLLRSTTSPSSVSVKMTANTDELVGTDRYQIGAALVFRVDGSSQLEYTYGGTGTLSLLLLDTIGWRDERGKNA